MHYVGTEVASSSRDVFSFAVNPVNPMFDLFLAADMCMDVILQGNTRPQFSQVEQLINDYAAGPGRIGHHHRGAVR